MEENRKGYVLALYDFRSKQEYIYRTNKIREISGGSSLLRDIYAVFIKEANIKYSINSEFKMSDFDNLDPKYVGEVVYDGGGNLMILYKSKDVYINANHTLSKNIRENLFTANVIASMVPYTGNFAQDRKNLYAINAIKKNTGNVTLPYSVFPFTQIDRETFMPIVTKDKYNQKSLSKESCLKQKKYSNGDPNEKGELRLDEIVKEKGTESLLAIIYIDGNAMGEKLKNATEGKSGYDESIKALRKFSADTDNDFVNEPINAIEIFLSKWQKANPKIAHMGKYRRVIAGGDEITIICNARLAKDIVLTYFEALGDTNFACAGIALFHSHAPFADIYEIAEQCCEIGKKASRSVEGSKVSYIDFHFCRSAVTNDAETIREQQEKDFSARPYTLAGFEEFCKFANDLSVIGRSNIKELANALIKGKSYYRFEVERIKSRYPKNSSLFDKVNADKLIFDVAQVYDLWFEKEESNKTDDNKEGQE